MKAAELRKASAEDLRKRLGQNREQLQKLRFDMVAGKVKNVRDIRRTRREIAQILTILHE